MPRAPRSDELKIAVGSRLREARKAIGRASNEVCKALNIAENTYSQWENGKNLLDVTTAIRIKAEYGITLDFLYAGDLASLPGRMGDAIREMRGAQPAAEPAVPSAAGSKPGRATADRLSFTDPTSCDSPRSDGIEVHSTLANSGDDPSAPRRKAGGGKG